MLTLNRPEVRNAFSPEMTRMLCDAWDMANSDPSIRVVLLTGAGGAFCSGEDLKLMTANHLGDLFARPGSDPEADALAAGLVKFTLKGYRLDKPLITAIEGPAVAGGMELVLASDIRVAAHGARFGLPEVCMGLIPMAGGTVGLPRQIPPAAALELLLTGSLIEAKDAFRLGLISELVEDGQALARAYDIADRIAGLPPVAVCSILRIVRESIGRTLPEAERLESEVGAVVFQTDDAKEGPRAFAEKRPPVFMGR